MSFQTRSKRVEFPPTHMALYGKWDSLTVHIQMNFAAASYPVGRIAICLPAIDF